MGSPLIVAMHNASNESKVTETMDVRNKQIIRAAIVNDAVYSQ
jgi:hypothetical protein